MLGRDARPHPRATVFATSTLFALAALTLSACASGPAPEPAQPGGESVGSVTVEVSNSSDRELSIASWNEFGQRGRLGVVRPHSNRTFEIPVPGIVDMALEIRIERGPRCLTNFVSVGPGDRMPAFMVPPDIGSIPADCS